MRKIYLALKTLFNSENDFFKMAKTGKRITHIAIAIPLFIVLFIGGFIFSEGIIFQLILGNPDLKTEFKEFYTLFVSFSFVILFLWIWIRFFEKRPLETLGLTKNRAFYRYFTGFFTGFLMLFCVIALMAIFGLLNLDFKNISFDFNFIGTALLLLIGYIIQGASEEIITRGWQFQVIGARYKPWLGAVISSIIFTLLHGMNPGVSLIAVINLLLFSFLLILYILRYKSIWMACGWHSAWNWSMENIFGLNVSGSEGVNSLLHLSSTGPKYLTGGQFGPEGSIFTSIVLIMGMVILLVKNIKKEM